MVRATLIRLRLTPSIWLTVASTMWKNSATTTMKMAGALPMPNTKIATGSQAIGDTGDSSVMVGKASFSTTRKYRTATPMLIDRTDAISNPANTRAADASTVITSAMPADGPVLRPTDISAQPMRGAARVTASGSTNRRGGGDALPPAMPATPSGG